MSDRQILVLGGGCFWCTEAVYKEVRGITDVESGYCNGHVQQPTYEQVCTGSTGHNEVVRLEYDPTIISTREVLEIFFVVHDATTLNRQGNDVGTQYRSGIYFTTPEQAEEARALIAELAAARAFAQAACRRVTVDAHDQRGAQCAGSLEALHVAAVQQIEHPVGEDPWSRQRGQGVRQAVDRMVFGRPIRASRPRRHHRGCAGGAGCRHLRSGT